MTLHNPLLFESDQEMSQKTNQTLVKYKDSFMYCECFGSQNLHVNLTKLPLSQSRKRYYYNYGHFESKDTKVLHSSNVDLDFNTPELGFINTEHHTVYASRRASRQYQQGLSHHTLHIRHISPYNTGDRIDLFHKSFIPMLINTYHPLDHTLHSLTNNPDVYSQAFHKRYALTREKLDMYFLYMCSTPIGYIQQNKLNTLIIPHKLNQSTRQYKQLKDLGFHYITG